VIDGITHEVIRRLSSEAAAVPSPAPAFRQPSPRAMGTAPPGTAGTRVAKLIDHTALRPDCTESQIRRLCGEAREHGFATVCVNPVWVPRCVRWLRGSTVGVCTVVGFPLGASRTPIKALEATRACEQGAREIDMVLNIGELRGGGADFVRHEIVEVRRALGSAVTLKVILETALLSDDEKRLGARLAVDAGADYLKTSTGFGPGGATEADVRLLAEIAGTAAAVKASGGIRDLATLRLMIGAGAKRIGTSSSVAIMREAAAGAR
jgi:deoxyribose-phosphate aldolase